MANLMRSIATRPWYAISNSIAVGWASGRASISAKIFSASSGFILVISLRHERPGRHLLANIGHYLNLGTNVVLLLKSNWEGTNIGASRPKLRWVVAGPEESW